MIEFKESKFYKLLQDFFINNDKETFIQFLAEFYNRTEGIINKNTSQDELIKELRELFAKFNEEGIDENVVREKVNYFVENNEKIANITAKLITNTNKIENATSQLENITSQVNNITTNHLDINIRDYGAKCDGVTDDTQAIKRAINKIKESNAKCSLDLTHGTILISENIVIPPLVKVYGQGIYKTTIKAKEGVSIVLDITSEGIYNNEFYDFTIDGSNVSDIKGIYFNDKNNTINDENCKFENILLVNCTHPLTIGNNNRGNRFNNINIEHCTNGLVINGTDNVFNSIVLSSIENNGIEINGQNNHLSMCKVFYVDKVGCIVNGNINTIEIEVQENGLNGIEINGFLNNVNVLADTNGRISASHNIKIDGYKNVINGVCLFNSYLNGNITTHINILKGVINELNMICHGNKPYLTEGCISPSNKIIVNNKSLVKNAAEEGMVFEHFGTGTSQEFYEYFYNAPRFYNINTSIGQGGYYKKEIPVSGNTKYSSFLKAIVRGGICKITISFYNTDTLISEVNSEELNNYHYQDSIVFLNGDIPENTTKIVFNIKTLATTNDGYSESIILDCGFTIF